MKKFSSPSGRAFALAGRTSVAAMACALAAATPAFAQDAADAAAAEEEESEIVVSGFRAALESAVSEKKNQESIVESISAEDIGKLPDASIAESIARLPGLTSQRLSGRSQVISIRGFAPDFSTTLLNGREQVTTGDNRAVEFDQYPSEIINQVLIYKTPKASLVGQGLSGTVDLRTIRPLTYGKRVIALGVKGEYAEAGKLNAGSTDKGYRVNATYVDQLSDRVGIALAASYVDSPYQNEEFNAWGYPNVNANTFVIGGSKSYVTSTRLKRLGLLGTLEFEPVDNFTTTIDAYYSDFQDNQIKRGIETPLFWSSAQLQPGFTTTPVAGVNLVTTGQFNGVKGVVRNDANQKDAEILSFAWNGKYQGDDGWRAEMDFSYSGVDRSELILETYSGTGRGPLGATDNIKFQMSKRGAFFTPTLNYSDPNLIRLTSPQGWGGDIANPGGQPILGGQDGYYNNRIVKDALQQFRAEVEKEMESGFIRSVIGGVNYTSRTKSLTPDEFFLGLKGNTNGTTSVAIPSNALLKPTNLAYLGLGPMVSYDPVKLLNSGIYNLVRNPNSDVLTKGWGVTEDVLTAYLQANIRADIGGSELTGNFGVQMINTDQESTGFAARGAPIVSSDLIRDGASYTDWLPSLNLSLRTPADIIIRLGAAKEIARPKMDDMRATSGFGFNDSLIGSAGISPFSGGGGNPKLQPWRADAIDLSVEKYFGRKGYIALQMYYKKLESYIYVGRLPYDFTGFPIPSTYVNVNTGQTLPLTPAQVNYQGFLDVPLNGKGGELYGAELAGTLPFDVFTEALDGFGITGGLSYTKSKVAPQPGAPEDDLPGYSKWVANGTVYFEKGGFQSRVSARYRSSFIGDLSGFGGSPTRRRAAAETIIDAQLGYSFPEESSLSGLSIMLQGQNLTDERFRTFVPGSFGAGVIDYQIYGRRYLLGINYKL
jgi:iron complex outermembrane recepter protein